MLRIFLLGFAALVKLSRGWLDNSWKSISQKESAEVKYSDSTTWRTWESGAARLPSLMLTKLKEHFFCWIEFNLSDNFLVG